jgi:hypothetical protein
MKQKINLIVSNKGGCGKSTLFWLFSIANRNKPKTLFVDCDAATLTSTRQVAFLEKSGQLKTLRLVDDRDSLQRDLLTSFWEHLMEQDIKECFLDFGSAESEGLLHLIGSDIPFQEYAEATNQEFIFHVVVAGGSAYRSCTIYLSKLHALLGKNFKIIIWANKTSFSQFEELRNELHSNAKLMNLEIKDWGNIPPSTHIGNMLLDNIRRGGDLESLSIGPRITLMRELKTNFGYEE